MFDRVKRLWLSLADFRSGSRSQQDKDCIARPVLRAGQPQTFSWRDETILILGTEPGLVKLGQALSEEGAMVSFRSLGRLQDIYLLPLEQYTMVVLPSGWDDLEFDVVDIGGILRRADQTLVLVWASEDFVLSQVADEDMRKFCDIALSLPASAENLKLFLVPPKV